MDVGARRRRDGRGESGQAETSFAQVAADALGILIDWVTVVGGDTAAIPFGIGTFASRSAVNAGSSIHVAAGRVKDKLVAAAAQLFEAAPGDVEIADGTAAVRRPRVGGAIGSRDPVRAADVRARGCRVARLRGHGLPSPADCHVHERRPRRARRGRRGHGRGAAALRGRPRLRALINPVIVEGQIHGGVAQGVGGGLLEEMLYDDKGSS